MTREFDSRETTQPVSPETVSNLLGAINRHLRSLQAANKGKLSGNFSSTDKDGHFKGLRLLQQPIENTTDGVIAHVIVSDLPAYYPDSSYKRGADVYFFRSNPEGLSVEHYNAFAESEIALLETKHPMAVEDIDEQLEQAQRVLDKAREDESQAGLSALTEVEAQALLVMIEGAKIDTRTIESTLEADRHGTLGKIVTRFLGRFLPTD